VARKGAVSIGFSGTYTDKDAQFELTEAKPSIRSNPAAVGGSLGRVDPALPVTDRASLRFPQCVSFLELNSRTTCRFSACMTPNHQRRDVMFEEKREAIMTIEAVVLPLMPIPKPLAA
jgi:hypothetical protein